jgi:hypothetical protein
MAQQKEKFYQTPVDRTPYGACAAVGVIGIAVFILASIGLVRAGGWIQRTWHPLTFSTPTIQASNPFSGAEAQLQNLKDTAKDAASTELQKQQDTVKKEAANAARNEAQSQIDNLKDNLP